MTSFFYLHGWASSPQSNKAKIFQQQFKQLGLSLQLPDLNQPSFFHLTLTRQIQDCPFSEYPVNISKQNP